MCVRMPMDTPLPHIFNTIPFPGINPLIDKPTQGTQELGYHSRSLLLGLIRNASPPLQTSQVTLAIEQGRNVARTVLFIRPAV